MKTIAYIELDTHAEIASNFIELTIESRAFAVDYYFTKKIIERISTQNVNITEVAPGNIIEILKEKTYAFVILGTAHRYFNVFSRLVQLFPTYIITHNLNFSKASTSTLLRNILRKDSAYRLKLLLKEGLLKKNKVYQGARELLVFNENIVDLHHQLHLRWLPLFYTQFINTSPVHNMVAVPGSVDQNRRNYKRIFKKIKQFKSAFSFVFLGKMGEEEFKILKKTEKYLPKNIEIDYYEDRVPVEEFEQKIRMASILWCPIQEETEFFSVREVYGKTKVSGNIADAIRFAKPAIFPKTYWSSYSFIFKEEMNIEKQMLHIHQEKYDFTNFKKDIVRQELEDVLLSLTK